MSENKRSFFSTIPGLVTGLAGLLTGIVGLVTVLIQLGVLGGDGDGNGTSATATTVAGGTTVAGAGATPTAEPPRFSVSPSSLDFKLTDPRDKKVTVRNESSATTLTVSPQVAGTDRAQFSASGCSAPVRPGLSCEVTVTFAPGGPLRTYQASLQISAPGARAEEVRLTASTLLG